MSCESDFKEEERKRLRDGDSRPFYKTVRDILMLIGTFTFLSFYFLSSEARAFINRQIIIILGDLQLSVAVILLLVLTLGWYFIRALSMGLVYLDTEVRRNCSESIVIRVRFAITSLFFSFIFAHYIALLSFDSISLYIVAFSFWFSSLFLYYLVYRIRRHFSPKEQNQKEFKFHAEGGKAVNWDEAKEKYLLYVCLAILLLILYSLNSFGFGDFVNEVWIILWKNPWLAIYGIIVLFTTLLWGVVIIIYLLLINFLWKIFTEPYQKKINKMRIIFAIFSVCLLLAKNLAFVMEDDIFLQFISFILSGIVSLLSALVLRRVSP